MCYSSKVAQNIKDLARQFAAVMDYSEVEPLMMERLAGRPIRLARGFEWNFASRRRQKNGASKELDDSSRNYEHEVMAA